jgi:hypothetical protein
MASTAITSINPHSRRGAEVSPVATFYRHEETKRTVSGNNESGDGYGTSGVKTVKPYCLKSSSKVNAY